MYRSGGREELISDAIHCHHQNHFGIEMGSDVSHFNVSFIVPGKVTRQGPSTTIVEEKGEPRRRVEPGSIRLPAERLTTRPSRLTMSDSATV